jgi:hypothetical protein
MTPTASGPKTTLKSARKLSVEILEFGSDAVPGVTFPDDRKRIVGEPSPQFGILEQSFHRKGEILWLIGRHQRSCDIVTYNRGDASNSGGQNAGAAGESFEYHYALTFGVS